MGKKEDNEDVFRKLDKVAIPVNNIESPHPRTELLIEDNYSPLTKRDIGHLNNLMANQNLS